MQRSRTVAEDVFVFQGSRQRLYIHIDDQSEPVGSSRLSLSLAVQASAILTKTGTFTI